MSRSALFDRSWRDSEFIGFVFSNKAVRAPVIAMRTLVNAVRALVIAKG